MAQQDTREEGPAGHKYEGGGPSKTWAMAKASLGHLERIRNWIAVEKSPRFWKKRATILAPSTDPLAYM